MRLDASLSKKAVTMQAMRCSSLIVLIVNLPSPAQLLYHERLSTSTLLLYPFVSKP